MAKFVLLTNFKVSLKQAESYEKYWRGHGYSSKSDFFRHSADVAITGVGHKAPQINPTLIINTNIQLGRIATNIMDLVVKVANNNEPESKKTIIQKVENINRELKIIRKKVSKQ